ncbi:MAG: hypothetical protein COA44_06580 [Arcobacter sp.]|nr:MAG: hypothetical protein COA44_06580 [Arcobacter sp.]
MKIKIGSLALLTAIMSTVLHAESVLRISCEESSLGASIYINGKYKDKCPSTLFVKSGDLRIRAVLKVGRDHESVFVKYLRLADGSAKRIEVVLSEAQLTRSAKKSRAKATLSRARNGNISEMKAMAKNYTNGFGVAKSSEKSNFWRSKAKNTEEKNRAMSTLESAQAGNTESMSKIAYFYSKGLGVDKDSSKAQMWKEKEAGIFLSRANTGDIESMKKIAGFYAEGRGIKQSASESQKWYKKIEMIESEKLEKENKEVKNKETRRRLKNLDFFSNTKGIIEDSKKSVKKNPIFLITSPIPIATSILSDLITTPFNITEKIKLENQLKARASQWKNPNSMIAKAYKQKYELKLPKEKTFLSAR